MCHMVPDTTAVLNWSLIDAAFLGAAFFTGLGYAGLCVTSCLEAQL